MTNFSAFLKERHKGVGFTKEELAFKDGVGLRFIRDMEQVKKTLRLDKVDQVLSLFGKEVGVVILRR